MAQTQAAVRGLLRRVPPALILAAVLTRAAPAALSVLLHGDSRALLTPDSLQYLELASSLAWSGTFTREGFPDVFRTPLYPLVLVPGTWLGAPVAVAIALQVALAVLVTALVFDTAARLTASRRVAAAAAIIYLLEPGQPIWSSVVLADGLLTALAALVMWLAIRHPPTAEPPWRGAVLLGLVAAAGAYAKPPGYFLAIILAVAIGAAWWRRAPRRRLLAYLAALLIVNAAAVSVWHVRNGGVAGYAGFSTQFERAAFMAAPAALEGVRTGDGFAVARGRIGIAPGGEQEVQSVRQLRRSGFPALLSSLPEYTWLHLKGSVLLLTEPGLYWWGHVLGREVPPAFIGSAFRDAGLRAAIGRLAEVPLSLVAVRGLLSLWPLCCLALCAAVAWRRRGTPPIVVLGVVVFLWVLLSGGPHADIRLRSPIVPLLSVLAAAGLQLITRDVRRRGTRA
jgi:4-amino-4-deoxy-L-arabinose transferase-like glycosyltransferase